MAEEYPPLGTFVFFGSTRTLSRFATSLTLVHMGPAVSKRELTGSMPSFETIPRVGFKVHREFLVEGDTNDPSVSVSSANGASPAAIEIPDPDEEPPGL